MNEDETPKFWLNKKAKLEIKKDGKRLIYTADIVEYDDSHITFIDRAGVVYSFNRELICEMQLLEDSK